MSQPYLTSIQLLLFSKTTATRGTNMFITGSTFWYKYEGINVARTEGAEAGGYPSIA